jgi:hypothetical protein
MGVVGLAVLAVVGLAVFEHFDRAGIKEACA